MCLLWAQALSVSPAHAQENHVYQTDQYGNVQYHKPGYAILSDGRIIEIDSGRNQQQNKPQYKIKDGTVYEADSSGVIQYHKPSLSLQADGQIFPKDRSGNILYGKDHYVKKDDNIYQADRFGNIQYRKPSFKVIAPKWWNSDIDEED